MKRLFPAILTIAGFFGLILSSCISDAVSTSSSDILAFSRDTVSFDTVFTDLGTPTARLIVFNRNKKGVEISSIRLRQEDSPFSINVDGRSGKTFSDVEIRGNDSIYMFIECYLPETASSEPYLVEDELEFVTNGVTQTIRLEAYGQNVTRLRASRISSDVTLGPDRPIVVFDSLVVDPQGVLRILPDTRLLFHDGAELIVHGRIEAVGEPGKLIQMRGDRLDNVLPDVGYDILAGQWKGVRISRESFDNRLEYVDMRSTVEGLMLDSCVDMSRSKLLIRNSWLHNSQGSALTAKYSKVDAYGVCFSEAADAVVNLTGGEYHFVQCTFANNYLFSAINALPIYPHILPLQPVAVMAGRRTHTSYRKPRPDRTDRFPEKLPYQAHSSYIRSDIIPCSPDKLHCKSPAFRFRWKYSDNIPPWNHRSTAASPHQHYIRLQ